MSDDYTPEQLRKLMAGQPKDHPFRRDSHTMQVGKGHISNTPNLPIIREILPEHMTPAQQQIHRLLEPGTRSFRMGVCHIELSPPFNGEGWHLSISTPKRYPTWDEVAKAWYELVPEADGRTAAMILPPKADYINIHNYCFQVHEIGGGDVR